MQEPNSWVEIVSVIAHDLKTPITSVKGFIELMKHSGPLNERQEHFSERALSALKQMESLVQRLLELAWIDADRPLEPQLCDLTSVIENAVAMLRDYADRRQIVLSVAIDPDLGTVQADERRLDQVMLNLLSNAIKYNRKGGEVSVAARSLDENVQVSVRDTGVGISENDQQYIFERFFRSRTPHEEKIEGTGLGLSIVKAVIEKHGGQVWVESREGVGSIFTFTLPRVMRLSEGEDITEEAISPRIDSAEGMDLAHSESLNEVIDAVDDNIQEPPQTYLDRDDADVARKE
jgi:signal transduction histidine kinase